MSGKGKSRNDTESMRVAQEAIGSNRTVTTHTLEEYFFKRFKSYASENQK